MVTVAAPTVTPPAEHQVLVPNVSWATYEGLLADLFGFNSPRLTYDRGQLEIMVKSGEHDETSQTFALLVGVVTEEFGVDFRNLGQATFKRKDLAQGFEPDMCFFIHNKPTVRDTIQFDPSFDQPPDLVIEVDLSRSSLNRFPIFAGFGIREVWRYRRGNVEIWKLQLDKYVRSPVSEVLPPLTGEVLTRFIAESRTMGSTAWMRSVRAWAREQAETATAL